jgi:hypothetical protein
MESRRIERKLQSPKGRPLGVDPKIGGRLELVGGTGICVRVQPDLLAQLIPFVELSQPSTECSITGSEIGMSHTS